MELSQAGMRLIKDFEGCKLNAYRCSAGVPTIGFGHTEGVSMGDEITQEQADKMLLSDLSIRIKAVAEMLEVELTPNQFAALVSLAFNVGLANVKKSTLLKMINRGEAHRAGPEFLRWNRAGGKELAGLTRRRQAEKALYES